ncbi:MAG TPA: glycosyltransferase family 87 protein [Candidatus Sulfotelmatobacter sp.]|jgi:hypothetical protein
MSAPTQFQRDTPTRSALKLLLWLSIVLAGAEFTVRGPVRFLQIPNDWNDLSQNYAASKLWLKGRSPADPGNFVALWKQESGSRLDLNDVRTHLAPPLGGLIVLAPIAVFHFKTAKMIWLVVLLLAFVATVLSLIKAGGLRWGELRTLAFVAACLALAPFQTGIGSGNATVLVIGLCALAIGAATENHDISAGFLFGLSCSLKPQIGAFLVLYYLMRRRWQLFVTAVSTAIGLIVVAALYLQLRGTSWLQDYLHNAQGFVTSNHIDDFSSANPSRFTLINLQVPLFSITGQSSLANWLAFGVVGVLLCVWLYWVGKGSSRGSAMLALGAISVVALLPVYHRFYDAGLLAVPLCWCVTNAADMSKSTIRIVLLLMAPFLFPGAAFLQQLVVHGHISDTVANSWWWNCVVMPHESWALLLLCLLLLYRMKLAASHRLKATP